ncbi:MAG TPA: hypothetical protein VJ718_06890, partial [Candidatus Binataceae bacterium]|nr:hypothetical protein [Candidatus Binataceae bacterium]
AALCVLGESISNFARYILRTSDNRVSPSDATLNKIAVQLRRPVALHIQDDLCPRVNELHERRELGQIENVNHIAIIRPGGSRRAHHVRSIVAWRELNRFSVSPPCSLQSAKQATINAGRESNELDSINLFARRLIFRPSGINRHLGRSGHATRHLPSPDAKRSARIWRRASVPLLQKCNFHS